MNPEQLGFTQQQVDYAAQSWLSLLNEQKGPGNRKERRAQESVERKQLFTIHGRKTRNLLTRKMDA